VSLSYPSLHNASSSPNFTSHTESQHLRNDKQHDTQNSSNNHQKKPTKMSTMHAAIVSAFGKPPTYSAIPTLAPPTPSQLQLRILATGLHNVVRSRARGAHYSSPPLPQIPGTDGIGVASDGTRYYFNAFRTGGSFASHINVERGGAVAMPKDLDTYQAAALVNPATSSWMSMKTRAANLPSKFTVLILGATSASGRLAIPLARALGAAHIIGAARNASTMSTLGLDSSLVVAEDPSATDFSSLKGKEIDLILDYVNGSLPAALLSTHKQSKPLQFVHIGTLSGQDMVLPGAALRSNDLTIRGSGPGAWSFADAAKELPEMLEALATVGEQNVRVVKLEDVEEEWERKVEGEGRVVFAP
jgi:NADPH:quinone reductase-like Zn-dependent oxidoreductase